MPTAVLFNGGVFSRARRSARGCSSCSLRGNQGQAVRELQGSELDPRGRNRGFILWANSGHPKKVSGSRPEPRGSYYIGLEDLYASCARISNRP